jgi:hypothetical protein
MTTLKPWADGPFELILHAELHMRDGTDFDRRIALISFDNAIEVAIATYLALHPLLRQNRTYSHEEVKKWLSNYHSKVDFFFCEATERGLAVPFDKAELVWYHEVRNGQYHVGGPTVPRERELAEIRAAALGIFSILFDIGDVEELLQGRIGEMSDGRPPKRDQGADRLIDERYGVVRVAGLTYYTSELLYGVDPFAYRTVAADLQSDADGGVATKLAPLEKEEAR